MPSAAAGRPSVSVVIPVKDDAVALDLCLRRLARQTVAPLEVVVVDNGSRDDSAAVARRHGARVVVEPRPGIPAANAAGCDAAVGDVLARCDADTVPGLRWVERIGDHFAGDPGLTAVTGTGVFYDVGALRAALLGRAYLASYYLTMHAAIGRWPLWGSSMALRRATWQSVRADVHPEDPELHDDVDLTFALGAHLGRDARIRLDRRLVVGVSGRSLVGGPAARRRFARAFRTLAVHWAVQPPWERWRVRLDPRRPSGPPRAAPRPRP